ncbi:MAG: hypothetical protein GKR98_07990 [Boseongicola sp.]|nr:MAG: hypothetical protein GKR98_07990 [Boseongicola sp.]
MRNLYALMAGGLFGVGLYVSGMTNTQKVIGWLDFFGEWDPTLAFVLGGAILPMAVAWQIAKRRQAPVLGGSFPANPEPKVGRNIIVGSLLFGAGWGMVGLCPGPAMASLTWGGSSGLIFLLAMLAGMLATPTIHSRLMVAAT